MRLPKLYKTELKSVLCCNVVPLLALASFVASPSIDPILAQDGSSASSISATNADEAAIRQSVSDFIAAFKRHDAKAISQMWTEDGEYVDEDGQKYEGREAIEREYEQFFQNHKGVELRVFVDSILLINPLTAIEDGSAVLDPLPVGAPAGSKYVAIHTKQDNGKWLLASVRDSRIDARSTNTHLQPLELLVGDWTAELADTQADVSCHWNTGKSFLERHFVVTRNGKPVSTSTEIIGWDPVAQQVTSWTFSSNGGRAKGRWTALEDGWVVENEGITIDGTMTSSVDVWAPLLDGALGWRSTRRSVGGEAVQDSNHVVFKRKAPATPTK